MRLERIRVVWPDAAPDLWLAVDNLAVPRSLAERIARVGRPLNTRCARRGLCAGCTVQLAEGSFRRHDGILVSGPAEVKACEGDVPPGASAVIIVPPRSVIAHRPHAVSSFKVGVTAANHPSVPVLPGVSDHGLAIDVGTTTVVVALVELQTGRIVREESAFNRQLAFGDDVLTRIQLAAAPAERDALRRAIVHDTLSPLVRAAVAAAGIEPDRVAGATIAGNTTMLHLLIGADPTTMGVAPFRAGFTHHRVLTAGELELRGVPEAAPVHLLPGFSAYVGADLVAGCVCTGLLNSPGPALLIDIGTNGEILLWHDEHLLATATAAGPAFEGGRLASGTRAAAGAIAHVAFTQQQFPPLLEVIPGAAEIVGLCGSAYVDFLAQARAAGLLGTHGRINSSGWAALPAAHRYENGAGRGVRLSAGDPATVITEADVAQLLQAKAAIAAGIILLLRRAGLAAVDVKRVYLAGGFGLHLDVRQAIACGLLPGFAAKQVEVVGNASLGGAWLALIDSGILPEMTAASRRAEIVQLNREPGFEDTYIDQLTLP